MFGSFQQSQLRIEVDASAEAIAQSLLEPGQIQKWLTPQQLSTGLPPKLHSDLTFTSSLGPITIQHRVEVANDHCLRMILSQGIDGFHEWYWGEGWVQSRLEGVSVLPLNIGQTLSLWRLREFLTRTKVAAGS
jgi:hypothetical protein